MQDNARFKINSYLQLLKYVDDADLRNDIVDRIQELLQLVSVRELNTSGEQLNRCCQRIIELFDCGAFLNAENTIQQLKQEGFSESTIKRAKARLQITSEHKGYGPNSKWIWVRRAIAEGI